MQMFQAHWKTWGIIRWRSLSWAEFTKFEELATLKCPMAISNEIYRAVVVLGPDPEELTAGVIEFIVTNVFSKSAFSGNANLLSYKLEHKRKEFKEDYLLAARAVVASMFKYTFEEIDQWDEDTFMQRLVQAEFVAGKELPVAFPEVKDSSKKPIPIKENKKPKRELTLAQQMVMDRFK